MTTNSLPTQLTKPLLYSKTGLLTLACLAALSVTPSKAQAQNLGQCLKNTASCGVKIAQTQIDLLAAATDVLAFAAANPNCIADITASNFVTIGISTSMVTLAAAGVIQQQSGSYKSYIYGQGGRPMVEAINSIVPVPALSNLLKQNQDELIGPAFAGIASLIPIPSSGAPNLDMQLDCGSAIAVAGQGMVSKVKSFVGHAKGAVKSCSAAASCFAGVMVDIVKDPVGALGSAGEFLADGADTVVDAVFGGCKNQDPQLYFDANFKPWQNDIAYKVIWGGDSQAYNTKARELLDNCVAYYDGCNSDPGPAKRSCLVMSTGGVQTDGNGWIAGKGLEQLVRTRQMELRIPQFLATDMKWAAAQPTAGRDTPILNQQFGRLPTQLQPLVKDKLSFSFKNARDAATRKIFGFEPGYNGNGDFGGKDAKVVMADKSIGALMLAYVPTQGAENKSTNTKVNDLYKQYIPSGNALLQQIDAAVGESMGAAIAEVVRQNGDAWNEAFTNAQLQKMVKRIEDCKDAHKDAKKQCGEKISAAIQATFSMMTNLGKAGNFAGIGALGSQHPAYKNYINFIEGADKTVGQHIAHSATGVASETRIATTRTPATLAPVADTTTAATGLAMQPPKVNSPLDTSVAGKVPASAPPAAGSAGRVTMPKAAEITAAPQIKAPSQPAQAALPAPSSGAVKQGGAIGMPSAPGMAAIALKDNKPPQNAGFIAAIEPAKTAPPAANAQQNNKPAEAVIVAVTPKEAAPLVTPPPPSPQTPKAGGSAAAAGASNNPVSNPNNNPNSAAAAAAAAEKLVPFDEPGYRQERANVLYPLWLTKCNNNSNCLQAMAPVLVKRIDVEASAIRSGKPDYKDKPAVAKLQASLNPIYDPQLEAVIPKIATSTPVTGGNVSSQIPKNLKPGAGFKP